MIGACLDGYIENPGAISGGSFYAPTLLYLELALGFLGRGPVLVGVLLDWGDALRLALNRVLGMAAAFNAAAIAFEIFDPAA